MCEKEFQIFSSRLSPMDYVRRGEAVPDEIQEEAQRAHLKYRPKLGMETSEDQLPVKNPSYLPGEKII